MNTRRVAAAAAVAGLLAGGLVGIAAPAYAADPYTFTNTRNPDPRRRQLLLGRSGAARRAGRRPGNPGDRDELYIYTGHDEAGPSTNDFIMNEWGAFRTTDVQAGEWTHYPSLMRPEQVFAWATPGRAYAGQVVRGVDGRYYWYVPINERDSPAPDKFAIGVAVSDSPTGPWTDHAGGPIISQRVPTANNIHNIDPTILVEGQRVFVWWGSFSNLRMLEFQSDMKTPVGTPRTVTGLTGFFEAAWIFKRGATYYMAYAGNNAGPTSQCTPANYHACIAYATAAAPEGPWTYRGTMLRPVSSTTSHAGILEFNGQWYIAYHTADAVGGGHFRRSVAIDKVEWDDTQTPPRMKPVTPTPAKGRDLTPRPNIAQEATVTVSNEPVPTQYWVKALNDEIVRSNPLPPDMWGTWTGNNPPQQWVQYTWGQPMRISGSQIEFWNDQPQGTGVGVAAPARWRIQYWDLGTGQWADVPEPERLPDRHAGLPEHHLRPGHHHAGPRAVRRVDQRQHLLGGGGRGVEDPRRAAGVRHRTGDDGGGGRAGTARHRRGVVRRRNAAGAGLLGPGDGGAGRAARHVHDPGHRARLRRRPRLRTGQGHLARRHRGRRDPADADAHAQRQRGQRRLVPVGGAGARRRRRRPRRPDDHRVEGGRRPAGRRQ